MDVLFIGNCGSANQGPQTTLTRCSSGASPSIIASHVEQILEPGFLPQSPLLPQPPMNFFGCDMIIGDLLSLVDRSASVILLGAGGIGKTAIALTLLHHTRITVKFGNHRHFMRCDDLVNSLDVFLGHLSEAIGARCLTDMERLRSHLSHSPPCILVLDGVEAILDPLAPGTAEIAAAIEELGRCQNFCLLATSRMDVKIPGFRRVDVPMLSADGAQDIFYSCSLLRRSAAVDNLLEELDFHPLSINLLASAARKNDWDGPALLEAWNDGKTNILKATDLLGLEESIISIFDTPTIQALGTTAMETLEAIAKFPHGVRESRLEVMFTEIAGVGEATDALCKFSLIYRQDGYVKMLSPFRFYFLEPRQIPVTRSGSETALDSVYTQPDVCNFGLFFSFHWLCDYGMTVLEGPPVVMNTKPSKEKLSGFTHCESVKRGLSPHLIISWLRDNIRLKWILHPPEDFQGLSIENPDSNYPRLWEPNLSEKFNPQREVSTAEVGTLRLVPLIIFQKSLPSFAPPGDLTPLIVHKMEQPM